MSSGSDSGDRGEGVGDEGSADPSAADRETVHLGEVDPAGSRQRGRRSAVAAADGAIVVGLADGSVVAFDADSTAERWRVPGDEAGSIVSAATAGDAVLVGERGTGGRIRALDLRTGAERWRHDAGDDLGPPQKETRFFYPFVADLAADEDRRYAAARRYERADGERTFVSVVYAFDPDGAVVWRYEADASPIALDANGDRVAVAYNRCPGDHRDGVVVLDAAAGTEGWTWDPPGGGDRRVGDVSLLPDGAAAAGHADYRGYRLGDGGEVRWRADLGRPVEVGDETVYAYPNHVHATPAGVCFVTGNTYPEEGREAAARHPNEHTAAGFGPDGEERWRASVGGFAHGIGVDGERVLVPSAQHFRERDPAVHGVRAFDLADGPTASIDVDGVVAAAAIAGDVGTAVEEPVAYHDEGEERGAYRLHRFPAEA